MLTINVSLYDVPIHSPLALELAALGIAEPSEMEKVRTILRIEKDDHLLQNFEWKTKLTDGEIEKIRSWAEQKYGEACRVQID